MSITITPRVGFLQPFHCWDGRCLTSPTVYFLIPAPSTQSCFLPAKLWLRREHRKTACPLMQKWRRKQATWAMSVLSWGRPQFRVTWVEESKEILTQIYEPGVLRWQPRCNLSRDTQTPFNGFYLSNLCGVLRIQVCTEQGKWQVAHSLYSHSHNVSLSTYGVSEDLN